MKNFVLVTFSMLLSTVAMAQSLGSQAQSVASAVQREERDLSNEQRSEIARLLNNIREVLYGGGGSDMSDLTCVARDNDGRNPYVMALRQGINTTRLRGETYRTENECREAIRSARLIRGTVMMCASRDNDGRNPFQLAVFDGTDLRRISRTTVKTQSECLDMLNKLSVRGTTATMCLSRDNDGQNPYVAVALNVRTLDIQTGTEVFRTKSECERFLGN